MRQRVEDTKDRVSRPLVGFASVLVSAGVFLLALVGITIVVRFVVS